MQPRLLQLRRLIIANADLFPDLGRTWYERGFQRVIGTLATHFQRLTKQGLLKIHDPELAAHHFVGLLLWIPMNEAMFMGDYEPKAEAEIARQADSAVRAFLTGYGPARNQSSSPRGRTKPAS
jgi:TetR/AcrR family transcriptional repressor of mexJK operon